MYGSVAKFWELFAWLGGPCSQQHFMTEVVCTRLKSYKHAYYPVFKLVLWCASAEAFRVENNYLSPFFLTLLCLVLNTNLKHLWGGVGRNWLHWSQVTALLEKYFWAEKGWLSILWTQRKQTKPLFCYCSCALRQPAHQCSEELAACVWGRGRSLDTFWTSSFEQKGGEATWFNLDISTKPAVSDFLSVWCSR